MSKLFGNNATAPSSIWPTVNAAELRNATPLSRIYWWKNTIGQAWRQNTPSLAKAYFFACLSEVAYLHQDNPMADTRGRYSIYASTAQEQIHRWRLQFDITALTIQADIPSRVVQTEHFTYGIFRLGDVAVVAVRGSRPVLSDWAINFDVRKVHCEGGFLHRGFSDEAKVATPLLTKALGELGAKDCLLYFTGHSLGGAVAATLSILWHPYRRPMTPYIFAAPRYASTGLVAALAPYSLVTPNDLVPHLPPKLLGYADAGLPLLIIPPDARCWSVGRTLLVGTARGLQFIAPHKMEGYRHGIGLMLGEKYPASAYTDAMRHQLSGNAAAIV